MSVSGPSRLTVAASGDPCATRWGTPEAAQRVLGESLRQLRHDAGLTLREVAEPLRGSEAKVSRLERGAGSPKERDIEDLIVFFRVPDEKAREIRALLRQARESPWWSQFSDVTPSYLRRLIGLEGSAAGIHTYENHVVPGLLQTEEYARAVIRAALPQADLMTVERKVELRVSRQKVLQSAQPPMVRALLDEAILRRPVGDYGVMWRQLRHLREVARRPSVRLRVVEFEQGTGRVPHYPITRLHFGDGGPSELVYVEHLESATYVTRPTELERYRSLLEEVGEAASGWERTEELLTGAIEEYRRKDLGDRRARGRAR
ncbi:Helix-turn-helix domain-containing protein [Streptomyces zhaozhouensis]|uniref:Helix-turn-helix domain-containing protein n=1 Tax=Streptomyces zhaozhouensis TaxID=1300267 RepID=A0A286DUD9_9ACTN|nr:helix-turn-helix transcriptional regulator [Streptomyces zhaozhouensis]SOD62276.1 Helix-turn-helix domain-containing protein [Streptomyces zhaozhouensis]